MKRIVSIVVIAAFVSASCGSKKQKPPDPATGSAAAAGSGTAAPTPAPPADPAVTALAAATADVVKAVSPTDAAAGAHAGALIDAIAAAAQAQPRDAWDPAAVVKAVGKDRVALFRWVRDRTALVPYRGSLRGAVGVMMDRVGNSLDRALLLAALLTEAGLSARLANAQLAPDAVARLTASWSTRTPPALPETTIDQDALFTQIVAGLGLDPAASKAAADKLDASARAVRAAARDRIVAQAAALGQLVPATPADPVDEAALADHWWVQAEDNEVWTDLDPSLADAEPGQILAPAGETLAPAELAQDRQHTLTVRVIGEVWHGDTAERLTLLEHTLTPSQYFGQRISVSNAAFDMPEDDVVLAAKDPAQTTRAAIADQTEWAPVLRVGASAVIKLSATDTGETHDVGAADANTTRLARAVQRATKAGVGGATDLLGGLPDDPAADPAAIKPVAGPHAGFTGEWIELELRSPGAPARVARREVFDAISPADRAAGRPVALAEPARLDRGLALLGETELLPMFARIPAAFVVDRTAKALVEARPALVELASLGGKPAGKELRVRIAGLPPLPGSLYALALGRFDWSELGTRVYLDRLDLLTLRRKMAIVGAEVRRREGFDIVANEVAIWPTPGLDVRAARLTQGVADTVAEAFIVSCAANTTPCERGANTSDLFAVTPTGWTAAAAGTPALAALGPAARALAEADLAAGYAVVLPPAGGGGWWRVNPSTGEVLGMGASGGNATAEQIALLILVSGLAGATCIVGSTTLATLAVCSTIVVLGAVSAYAGIEYQKLRALVWATALLGGMLGLGAAGYQRMHP